MTPPSQVLNASSEGDYTTSPGILSQHVVALKFRLVLLANEMTVHSVL